VANVLLVFAHPDDESFGPGATIAALARRGHRLTLLTLTRGEQSTLGVEAAGGPEALAELRERELGHAARELGIGELRLHRYPDGGLAAAPREELLALVASSLAELQPEIVVTFGRGGISGHSDHVTIGQLALEASAHLHAGRGLPRAVYGWAMPAHIAAILKERLNRTYPIDPDEDLVVTRPDEADFAAQWRAIQHHQSQHGPPPLPSAVRFEVQAGQEFISRLLPERAPDREPLLELLGQE
jgi:LmbE family N-acetylglucosaminyl deacetylase